SGLSGAEIQFGLGTGSLVKVQGSSPPVGQAGGNVYSISEMPAGMNLRIQGGSGNDSFQLPSIPPAGDVLTLDVGGGAHTLDESGLTGDVTVNLRQGTATGILGGIRNIQNVIGGAGNDTLIGDEGANVLMSGEGHDILLGLGGNDTL